ncbi:MAG: S1 RNA-binding domain-containing protein [Fuerstiella sp.]
MTTDEVSPQGDSVPPAANSAQADVTPPKAEVSDAADAAITATQETPTVTNTAEEPTAEPAVSATPVVAVSPATVVDQSAPTPSVAEMMAASTPQAAAAPVAVEVPPVEAVPAEVVAATAPNESRPADRIREKLASGNSEKPVGSEDIKNQRPDAPTNVKPVDIPATDDLDSSLADEIASALGEQTAPVVVAPQIVVDPETGESKKKAPPEPEEIGVGSKVSGIVQHIHGDDIFVNAGLLADVVVSSKQFAEDKQPAVGTKLTVIIDDIDGDGLFRARLPTARTKTGGNWDGLAVGQVVDCQVTGVNKGGLQVSVSSLKAFLPASQIDLGFVAEMEQYVGQKLTVQITEVKPKKRNLVVSRKALLLAEREEAQAGFWETLEVGKDYTGTVKTLKNYGAFVNIGPIDAFLHVGEISWSRINHPNEVLKEGQEVQVRVLKIDKEKNRISLGMKQLVQNPWQNLGDRYPSERIVTGRVTRVAEFGAFVELEPGVEGMVHVSELAWRRVGSVGEVLKVNDEKEFKVLEVDPKRKRVSLSLKALEQKPESAKKNELPEEVDDRPVRKPNLDLRGGMGGGKAGGGLFGNPSDFTG